VITNIKIITGKIERNIYGQWSDVTRGLFIDQEKLENIFEEYEGQHIKITIEPVNHETDTEKEE